MRITCLAPTFAIATALVIGPAATATPANKRALADFLGPLQPAKGFDCRTCHVAAAPTDEDHDHNAFGARLAAVRSELRKAGKPTDLRTRLEAIADEDSDGDGVANLVELLTGHSPGDAADKPAAAELKDVETLRAQLRRHLGRLPVAAVRAGPSTRAFQKTGDPQSGDPQSHRRVPGVRPPRERVEVRPEAREARTAPARLSRSHRLAADAGGASRLRSRRRPGRLTSASWTGLLASPQYGERWGRHWMDVWRYSDWAGYGAEVRESQPHIWRWRDWIVESLNADVGYDRMVRQMIAGDEIAPTDPATLRATGFLVRQYYKFNRNVVLDSTVEHTAKAFLGVTLNCARCHDHMYDPISQHEYYSFRAFFEPVQVRIDRVPGQPDTAKDGLVACYDAAPVPPTHLFIRGDEKTPDPAQICEPAVPAALGGPPLDIAPVPLPRDAVTAGSAGVRHRGNAGRSPAGDDGGRRGTDGRPCASRARRGRNAGRRSQVARIAATPDHSVGRARTGARAARCARRTSGLRLPGSNSHGRACRRIEGTLDQPEGQRAAELAVVAQRQAAVATARRELFAAEIALGGRGPTAGRPIATKRVAAARKGFGGSRGGRGLAADTPTSPAGRCQKYPASSTGRRLALARWITDRANPLAARVAVNHVWARHFGEPLVPTMFDFGRNGQPPTHPALLDWLAAEFMDHGWSMKHLHRLMVTSATYRADSRPDPASAAIDPDNRYLWRMNPRRMEAEVVRDSVLAVAGRLDLTVGGPDLDYEQGLTTFRRSLYYRHANEKQMLFLTVFDAANVNECYRRTASIVPQQALALANSSLTADNARAVAARMGPTGDDAAFVQAAFRCVLGRPPTPAEADECVQFLVAAEPVKSRERLIHVLFNHHDFVTIR